MTYISITLYTLGAFMTWVWWKEVKRFYDKNWQGLVVTIFWPITAMIGIFVTVTEWWDR